MKVTDFIKRNILFSISMLLVFAGIGVYATTGGVAVDGLVDSSEVTYGNSSVEAAVNDLYSKVGGSGTLKTVTLGTATSYNIKNLYPDLWNKLTSANFYYKVSGGTGSKVSKTQGSDLLRALYTAPSVSYNTSTGVLTCGNGTAKAEGFWSGDGTSSGTASLTTTTTCYMVYVE